jgi:glycerol-3-phosphate dehydrogenase
MDATVRDLDAAAERRYDLLVIGGGIYGVMVLHEASRRGLSCLVLERGEFGAATSRNNFRILHGGLRYLQKLDLPRFRQSVQERRWFQQHFPQLTRPLPCLMPLYGRGLKRRSVLRLALRCNDLLSADRNRGLVAAQQLPAGTILEPAATLRRFPYLPRSGLDGAALWYDVLMPRPRQLLLQALRQACGAGRVQAFDHCAVTGLQQRAGRVLGVVAEDRVSGRSRAFWAGAVVNAAGPWSEQMANRFGAGGDGLYPPTLAWNLRFSRPAPFEGAVALMAPDGRALFLLACEGRLLAGTGHAPWFGGTENVQPDPARIDAFVAALNAAAPCLELDSGEVDRIYAGLLPGRSATDARLRDRPMIVDHGRRGGPCGLWSVTGVKFTTARRVAEALLRRIYPSARAVPARRGAPAGLTEALRSGADGLPRPSDPAARRGGPG